MSIRKMLKIFITGAFLFFIILTFINSNDVDPVKIVEEMENRLNYNEDISAKIILVRVTPDAPDKVLIAKYYRRDKENKFVIIFEYPDSEKGKGYLRIGDDFWMYLPSTREFIHKNRKESVGNTDAKGEFFEKKKTTDLYNVKLIGIKRIFKWDCYEIQLKAKIPDVSYPIQIMYIRKDDYLPVKIKNYSLSNRLMQTQYFKKYIKIGVNKFIFTEALIINNLEKGKKTYIKLENVSVKKIDDSVFTKAFLESQGR